MSQCRFCGSPVVASAAKAAVEVQTKLNAVCFDASYVMVFALGMVLASPFALGYLFPFDQLRGVIVFGLCFLAVPFLTIRSLWRIKTIDRPDEPAIRRAKPTLQRALAIWIVMIAVLVVIGIARMTSR